jgi:hypothetical protein
MELRAAERVKGVQKEVADEKVSVTALGFGNDPRNKH